jgi:phage FluMu protein Com
MIEVRCQKCHKFFFEAEVNEDLVDSEKTAVTIVIPCSRCKKGKPDDYRRTIRLPFFNKKSVAVNAQPR